MRKEDTRLVYSTDRIIPRKGEPVEDAGGPLPVPSQQKVIVRLDRKGRGGKSVTVIQGLSMPARERSGLLKRLKAGLGTGGTVRESSLEIQGDHCDAVMASLSKMGYRPKRSGG